MVIPYCPSLAFYRGARTETRHCNRALLGRGVSLTVPVAGGARLLRGLKPGAQEPPRVSLHGDWPRAHLGALEAVYGRAPFFQHFFPPLAALIADPPETLFALNAAIDAEIRRAVGFRLLSGAVVTPAVAAEARRLRALADPQVSMLDPLFRFGPEAIFLLL